MRDRVAHGLPSSLLKAFAGNAVWSAVASVTNGVAMLVLLLLVTRWLGVAAAGKFVMFQTTVVAMASITGWGLATALTREIALSIDVAPHRQVLIVRTGEVISGGLGIVTATLLFLFAPLTADHVLRLPEISPLLRAAAGAIALATLDAVYKGVLTGQGRLRSVALITSAGAGAALISLTPLVTGFGVLGAAFAVCLAWFVQAVLGAILVNVPLDRTLAPLIPFGEEVRRISRIAFPATMAGAAVAPSHWIVQAFLFSRPGGALEVAILGICLQWFNALTLLPMSVGKIAMPIVARSLASDRTAEADNFLKYSILTNVVLTVPPALFLCVISPWVLAAYGPAVANGAGALILAMLCAIITAGQFPMASVIWAKSHAWTAALANGAWGLSFVVGAIILMPWGAVGIIWALIAAYSLNLVMLRLAMRARR